MAIADRQNVFPGALRLGQNPTAEAASSSVGGLQVAVANYSFAADGGAIGTINLLSAAQGTIPANAVIMGGYIEVTTLLTTGTSATMAISVEGANDIISATIVSGAPYSTTGRKSILPVFTGASTVKTTAARNVVATIATGTVTAGIFSVVLFYIVVA